MNHFAGFFKPIMSLLSAAVLMAAVPFLALVNQSLAAPIAPTTAQATAQTIAPADLQALFDAGQYSQLLAKLNKSIAAAEKPARYTLLMLKGEALLRTRAPEAAIDAFKAASAVGSDDHTVAMARANAALIRRSAFGKYQPKKKTTGSTTMPASIDIIEPATRKLAFAALFTDLFEPAKPQVERAEKLTTLPPIVETVTALADLRPVETGATGSDAQSKALLKKLGDHSLALMTAAVQNLDSQIDAISKDAVKRQKQAAIRTRGIAGGTLQKNLPGDLTSEDVDNLNSMIGQAHDIGAAAVSMQNTFGDAGNFKSVETTAQKAVDSANKLLKQYDHAAGN